MARYDLDEIRALLLADRWSLATKTCRLKVQALDYVRADVLAVLMSLTPDDWRKVYGECETELGVVEADDYVLWFDEEACSRCAPEAGLRFYIKLGIVATATGDLCAIVSFKLG